MTSGLKHALLEIKDGIDNIDAVAKRRTHGKSTESLSEKVEALKEMESHSFSNVSLGDIWEFKDGKLKERSNNTTPIKFKQSCTNEVVPFYKTYRLRRYIKEIFDYSLDNSISSFALSSDPNPNLAYLEETDFTAPLIAEQDYDYMFYNVDSLSFATVDCCYFLGGLNHTFENCKNLKDLTINIKNAHQQCALCGDYGTQLASSIKYTPSSFVEVKNCGIKLFFDEKLSNNCGFIKGLFETATLCANQPAYYNKYTRNYLRSQSLSTSIGLYNLVKGCNSLSNISFPYNDFCDFFDGISAAYISDNTSGHYNYAYTLSPVNLTNHSNPFKFIVSALGIDPESDVLLKFKDISFKASDCLKVPPTNEILDYAYYKKGLNSAIISAGISRIGVKAFAEGGTSSLTIANDSTLETIKNEAFKNAHINAVLGGTWTLPASVKHIGKNAFQNAFTTPRDTFGITLKFQGKHIDYIKTMPNYPFGLNVFADPSIYNCGIYIEDRDGNRERINMAVSGNIEDVRRLL